MIEDDAKRIELINHASVNSLQLIDELLEINREKTNQALEKEKINLQNLIKECAAIFEIRLNQKKIRLQFDLPEQPIIANVNAGKITRLISNLLSNAIKFSNYSSLIIVKLTSKQNIIILSVEDEGIGIPANELSNLFSIFTTSVRAGTSGEKSFGLGLSICKEITEAHGGKIWVQSEDGKGSTFFVELPM